MKRIQRLFIKYYSLALGFLSLTLFFAMPAFSQNIPSDKLQEIVIKNSIITFNDANLTGLYDVLNAVGSKPFREQLTPDKLKDGFKEFRDKHIDLSPIILSKPVATTPTTVDEKGVMVQEGNLDTDIIRVHYKIKTLLSDGRWQLLGIDVQTSALPK